MSTPQRGHIHYSLNCASCVILTLPLTPLFLFVPLSPSTSHPDPPEAPRHVSDCQVRLQPGHRCQGQGSPSSRCLQQGHQDRRAWRGILQSESRHRFSTVSTFVFLIYTDSLPSLTRWCVIPLRCMLRFSFICRGSRITDGAFRSGAKEYQRRRGYFLVFCFQTLILRWIINSVISEMNILGL